MNSYTSMTYTGSTMPVLPAEISNLWANASTVANIEMEYRKNIMLDTIDTYVRQNISSGAVGSGILATSDGNGTVTLSMG